MQKKERKKERTTDATSTPQASINANALPNRHFTINGSHLK